MKPIFAILIALAIMFTGCSEEDSTGPNDNLPDPPALSQTPEVEFTIPDSADLVDYVSDEVLYGEENVTAYSLVQFINIERDEITELEYTYEIVADDGYTPRDGDNPDLSWEKFQTGYLLPTEKFRTFFPNDEIETAYDVNWSVNITGGIFGYVNYNSKGSLSLPLQAGNEKKVLWLPIGFGRLEITATASAFNAEEVQKTVEGFLLLFFVIIL